MYKFKIILVYNEEERFCTTVELLSFKIILTLAKLVMVGLRFVSGGLIFSGDIHVDIQLVTFLIAI